jgi:multidrug efflux pump subunit AcrB
MSLLLSLIQRRITVTCVALLLLFLGLKAGLSMPLALFPVVEEPYLSIETEYPDASPAEVDQQVSSPLEDEISQVAGLKRLWSSSSEGMSHLSLEFFVGVDLDLAEAQVREAALRVRADGPREVRASVISRSRSTDLPVMTLFMPFRDTKAESRLRVSDEFDSRVRPALSRLKGLGRVEAYGRTQEEIQIKISQSAIDEYRMPITKLAEIVAGRGRDLPAGQLRTGRLERSLRTVGSFETIDEFREQIVSFDGSGRSIRLRDLATVDRSVSEPRTSGYFNGQPGLLIEVFKQPGVNSVRMAKSVRAEAERLGLVVASDSSEVIRSSLWDVAESIAFAFLFAGLVVWVWMGSLRDAAMTVVSIPIALSGAIFGLWICGASLNTMTLMGLSLAVGLMVDDAIVVRETIFRLSHQGLSPEDAARQALKELALPLLAVALSLIAVFLPLASFTGPTGVYLREFGLAVCLAVVVSLFEGLVIAPAWTAWGLRKLNAVKPSSPAWAEGLTAFYIRSLNLQLRWSRSSISVMVGFATVGVLLVTALPQSFLPQDKGREFSIELRRGLGTLMPQTEQDGVRLMELIRSNRAVESVVLAVSRGGDGWSDGPRANLDVRLQAGSERASITEELKAVVEQESWARDAHFAWIGGDENASGLRDLSFVLSHEDRTVLQRESERVFARLTQMPVVENPLLEGREQRNELVVTLNREQAQRLGVTAESAGREIRALVSGVHVGSVRLGGHHRLVDVRIQGVREEADLLQSERAIMIPNIEMVPVQARAALKISERKISGHIEKIDRRHVTRISADLPQGQLEEVLRSLRSELGSSSQVVLTPEGDAESFEELRGESAQLFVFSVLSLFLLFASLYESWRLSILNLMSLPLALAGAFALLVLFGEGLHLYSLVGILLLIGVATKNTVLLVDAIQSREKTGLAEACAKRLRPILMTSLALLAGAIPIVIGFNEATLQRRDMGLVLVGGVFSATLLSLFLIPGLVQRVIPKDEAAKSQCHPSPRVPH